MTAAAELPQVTLNPADLHILVDIGQGFTVAAIGRRRKMSPASMVRATARIREALGARSLPHAVALAYEYELLPRGIAITTAAPPAHVPHTPRPHPAGSPELTAAVHELRAVTRDLRRVIDDRLPTSGGETA